MGGRRVRTAEIVAALELAGGRVYLAADLVPCDVDTIYRRMSQSPDVRQALARARGRAVDRAEDALEKAVANGEAWAVCFTLKTLGRDRGYQEGAAPAPPSLPAVPRMTDDLLTGILRLVAPPEPAEIPAPDGERGELAGPAGDGPLGGAAPSAGPLAG